MDAAGLKIAKERLGWSTQRMATELRCSERSLWYYLNGGRPVPGPVSKLIDIYLQALVVSAPVEPETLRH